MHIVSFDGIDAFKLFDLRYNWSSNIVLSKKIDFDFINCCFTINNKPIKLIDDFNKLLSIYINFISFAYLDKVDIIFPDEESALYFKMKYQ